MDSCGNSKHRVRVMAALLATACVGTAWAQQADKQAAPVKQGQHTDKLKSAGKDASLTVLPVGLAGRSSPQVGEVLGMLL